MAGFYHSKPQFISSHNWNGTYFSHGVSPAASQNELHHQHISARKSSEVQRSLEESVR